MNSSALSEVISAQEKGRACGIPSICSANPFVLDAAFKHGRVHDLPLLIESTCNQVNQYGGYMGQNPFEFMRSLRQTAARQQYPLSRLVVGGDHLGPNPWRREAAAAAMEKSRVLVRDYVRAGYTKIHLDTSMACADDGLLTTETIAARAADLAHAAEKSYADASTGGPPPLYVIGTEVPAPGGVEDEEEGAPVVTKPRAAEETIGATREAFMARGLAAAWERVIAVVVQPGVEFGNERLYDYDPGAAAPLSHFIAGVEGVVFEAHSTDYQKKEALAALVRDHFAILKVGPALTFAMREALFALADIEKMWLDGRPGIELSDVRHVVDQAMLAHPVHWHSYYPGDERRQRYARQYSFSDRIRYYWPVEEVDIAVQRLLGNLSRAPVPLPLLSQYLPRQFRAVREGIIENDPKQMIQYGIMAVLDDYAWACGRL